MVKRKIKAILELVDGSEVDIEDDLEAEKAEGTYAREAVLAKDAVKFHGNDGESDYFMVIPYHSILTANFTEEVSEVPDPVDESCVEVE